MIDVCSTIHSFNKTREPERLLMKYRNMRTSPFIFLRATCHLFYERAAPALHSQPAPLTWCMGDMHLENFGSYKGDNRLAYFDLNDFDEAVLAPTTWDLIRFLTSILVGAKSIGISNVDAKALAKDFLVSYQTVLASGKSHWVERETSTGLIRNLLTAVKLRQRCDFLDHRTLFKAEERRIRIDGKKALAVTPKQRAMVEKFLKEFAQDQPDKKFFKPIDIARRIAGNGSLGVDRYIILVHGKGSPDQNYLLDLKEAVPSSLVPYLETPQPQWASEAHRVVTVQKRMQAVSMAFLQPVTIKNKPYILRALQPSEDRVTLDGTVNTLAELRKVIEVMGEVVASAQLRSSGRQGSATADELIDFAQGKDWMKALLKSSLDCAKHVNDDWKTYCKAYDAGYFAVDKF
ncbi:DUF2252 domain-containing protein [Undibacterium jejuense]|uniref:DUF2252 domain-containing protein n=1 Tax=Undibacterium jejuense TaxID=1344949 RepID=A0A923HLM4_9BURK|nr:DUF2252 domain-containing protein [Undibacterium jejuense]MBC3860963.1 DUF2252 domain-containing protein [Undibacterium jejuense]